MEYKSGRNPRSLYPLHQRGGDRIIVNGHPITILETRDHTTIVAYGGRFSPRRSCFRLDLHFPKRHAELQDVVRYQSVGAESCFDDGHNDGADVVRAIYQLARDRGMLTLEYTDNSSKHCSRESEEILHLSDYYTLLTGRTWYESIFLDAGATSVTLLRYGVTPAQLLVNRQNAAEVSWDTMRGTLGPPPVALPTDLDTTAPGSARRVLQYLRSLNRYDVCEYIGARLSQFLANSKILPIHGALWLCVIPQSTNTSTRRLTRKASSKRRSTLRRRGT